MVVGGAGWGCCSCGVPPGPVGPGRLCLHGMGQAGAGGKAQPGSRGSAHLDAAGLPELHRAAAGATFLPGRLLPPSSILLLGNKHCRLFLLTFLLPPWGLAQQFRFRFSFLFPPLIPHPPPPRILPASQNSPIDALSTMDGTRWLVHWRERDRAWDIVTRCLFLHQGWSKVHPPPPTRQHLPG